MATFPFNVRHQAPSREGQTQPCPGKAHGSSGNRQVPSSDPTLEDLFSWSLAKRNISLSNQTFNPWAQMDPYKSTSVVNWDQTLSEDEFWWQTFEQPLSAEVLSNTGSIFDDLHSKPESFLRLATSTYRELGNPDLHLDSLSDVEYRFPGASELGTGDYFQQCAVPDSALADFQASNISHDIIECKFVWLNLFMVLIMSRASRAGLRLQY
jgi:hypothetical protein